MRKVLTSWIAIMMIGISGCSQQTPMQKLKSDVRYDDMNNAYWIKQQDVHTSLWNAATVYCHQHTEKPNCESVIEIFVISNGSTKVPAYGSSGHSLSTPTINNP